MATDSKPKITLRASMLTDVGVVRDHNEDRAYIDPQERFFIVADGMGGHAAGEIASSMAVESVREALEEADSEVKDFARAPSDTGRKALAGILEQAVRNAHAAVYQRGIREPEKQGMGTTLDAALIAGSEAFVAHVGDSRTYLLRGSKLAQVTTDHTVAEVLLLEGKLSPEEALTSPLRTILVNAIGVADDVGVEMAHLRLQAGDQLLLSSDGLHDYFPSEEEIATELAGKPDEILSRMAQAAKERGGHDNITGLVVQILDTEERAAEDRPADEDAVPQPVARGDTLPFGQVLEPSLEGASAEEAPAGKGSVDAEASSEEEGGRGEGGRESAGEATKAASSSEGHADEAEDSDSAVSGEIEGEASGETSTPNDPTALFEDHTAASQGASSEEGAAAGEDASSKEDSDGAAAPPRSSEDESSTSSDGASPSPDSDAFGEEANGSSPQRNVPSPPVVAETKRASSSEPREEADDDYVEDDTLVGYDPDAVKPPAPKSDAGEGAEGSDAERGDPEAKLE